MSGSGRQVMAGRPRVQIVREPVVSQHQAAFPEGVEALLARVRVIAPLRRATILTAEEVACLVGPLPALSLH